MVTQKESIERLGSVPLFEGLTKTDLKHLVGISKVVDHGADHTIVSEGESGAGFHLILAGEAKVVRGNKTLARLGPGDFFGEMALIDAGPRTATVVGDGPLTTLAITAWDFRPLVKTRPDLAWKLLVHLTKRLREEQEGRDALLA